MIISTSRFNLDHTRSRIGLGAKRRILCLLSTQAHTAFASPSGGVGCSLLGGNSTELMVRLTSFVTSRSMKPGLRKGGTAGIYVVVMGLSWWIKAQRNQCDANAWAAVDDLSWVIQQMSNASDSASSSLQKRCREDEGNGEEVEEQPKEKRRYVPLWMVVFLIDEVIFYSRH